ncbi:MAG: AAA family ATPase [Eubacteriales bacterium]|nr:AAA family ATPase [Lachnospiraceae bacterium]MDO5126660.1 AAA family ATPase [Eubacteriales bacterium]
MTREGYIERVIYTNEDNGYAVFSVEGEDGEEIFVGTLYGVGEGLYIVAEGDYVHHPQYDIQFKFTSCEIQMPEDVVGIERYLSSGIIKGIGEVRAKQIVKKFKADTLRIIEEEPERLAEIKGISERQARAIGVSYAEKQEFREVVIFLSQYGISVNLAIKIYNEYGDRVYEIIRGNPYKLAEDITGVGFKMADAIARRMGIEANSEFRLRSALIYALNLATQEGHMYLPKQELIHRAVLLTRETVNDMYGDASVFGYAEYSSADSANSVYEDTVNTMEEQLLALAIDSQVIIKTIGDMPVVYSSPNYYVELHTARMLMDLQLRYEMPEDAIKEELLHIEQETGIMLDDTQRRAVKSAITAGVAVVTGGPGTGKTTIINAIIKYFSAQGMEMKLCAPTGRAAKRMTESTGWPAETIHRLLEFNGLPSQDVSDGKSGLRFARNASNPLECDAIIVDEMSMVDSFIFYALLQAVTYGTRLILVGDEHQLPSVGAGNVLKDIILSDCFPVTTLNKIYRQEDGSDIVYNAHRMNRGEHLEITNKSNDFFYIPRNGVAATIQEVQELVSNNLPKYLNISPLDIQVLTPMRKYDVGVENMNLKLQELLNPPCREKAERKVGDVTFREGDKVMQVKNNYKQEWKVYATRENTTSNYQYVLDEGVGVFNGDVGTIVELSDFDEEATILFDDGRCAVYSYSDLDELEHAFAITIHKSQGSEYPAVVIPLLGGTRKLLNRNLLYTAVTRAKRMVVIVGNLNLVNQMIDNTEEQKRYTSLALRMQEMTDVGEVHAKI